VEFNECRCQIVGRANRKMPDESQILLIGADNFAFPIPLKKNGAGQWYFDVAASSEEILARRIGRNELAIT
jgi:hypothetical protein